MSSINQFKIRHCGPFSSYAFIVSATSHEQLFDDYEDLICDALSSLVWQEGKKVKILFDFLHCNGQEPNRFAFCTFDSTLDAEEGAFSKLEIVPKEKLGKGLMNWLYTQYLEGRDGTFAESILTPTQWKEIEDWVEQYKKDTQ